MRKSRSLFLALLIAVVLPSAVAFAQVTNIWVSHTANTPDAAYDWSHAEHWNTPSGPSDGCYIKVYPDNRVFIQPSNIAVQYFFASGKAYFLGDVKVSSANVGEKSERGCLYSGAWHFGDVIFPAEDKKSPYVTGPKLCGRVIHNALSSSKTVSVPSGTIDFRFDRYARSSLAARTDDLDDLHNFYVGNGTINFYAPSGAEATSGTWRLTAGSTFAYRISTVAHPLAVGTLVAAGEALSSGTFLKHVFTDSIIELSAPALASGEIELSFAEFKPKFVATLPEKFTAGGADVKLCAFRNSIEDDVCVSFANGVYCGDPEGKLTLGFVDDKIPAVMRLGPITGKCKNGGIYLRNSHLAFENGVSFSANHPVKMPSTENGSFTSRFTVTDGQSVSIASLGDFAGTIVKDGEGTLKIGLNDDYNEGSFNVECGRLEIAKNSSAGEKELSLKSISLADGTTFVLPSGAVTVETFRATGTVTVSGGKIVVKSFAEGDLQAFNLVDGAEIELFMSHGANSVVTDPGLGAVVGHPAFWLDASNAATVEYETDENGVNHVSRWNDCRVGETMFCTNLVLKPTFVNGETMAKKYVKIARCSNAANYFETQILVWNMPIEDIRAVFLVQDPTDGGGVILGRTSWRVPNSMNNCSDGGPYYRGSYYSGSIVSSNYSTPAVAQGRFFLNGFEVTGTKTGYLGKFMQLVEHHVNTNLLKGTAKGLVCDAFGGSYVNPSEGYTGQNFIQNPNGGMRIAEYIIYTNELTHAERVSVAQYLSRKWLGRNVSWSVGDRKIKTDVSKVAVPGVALNVPENEELSVTSADNSLFVKKGGGVLHLNRYDGASIDVEEGEVVLSAIDIKRFVPSDNWLHVDAAAEDTLETAEDGITLRRWSGLAGFGEGLLNHGSKPAKVERNGLNNLPLVDLGARKSGSWLAYQGSDPENMVKTGFAVYDSSAGGSAVFGSIDSSYPTRGLPNDMTSTNIICEAGYAAGSWAGINALSNAVADGSALFRRNGEVIDPFRTGFLLGPERFSFRYPTGRVTEHFGAYGQSRTYNGGLKIGELILFDRVLADEEMESVEAYLAKKWFNIATPGYGSEVEDVQVAPDATLRVIGSGFKSNSLSGGGTIDGDVELASQGTLRVVPASDGIVDGLTFTGTLTLDGGVVEIPNDEKVLAFGDHVLASAAKITNKGGEWTLPVSARRNYTLIISNTQVILSVRKRGLSIICR